MKVLSGLELWFLEVPDGSKCVTELRQELRVLGINAKHSARGGGRGGAECVEGRTDHPRFQL